MLKNEMGIGEVRGRRRVPTQCEARSDGRDGGDSPVEPFYRPARSVAAARSFQLAGRYFLPRARGRARGSRCRARLFLVLSPPARSVLGEVSSMASVGFACHPL